MATLPVDPSDTPPPQSPDAERAVLAAMLVTPAAITIAREIITTESFYRVAHRLMFAAILALHDRGVRADFITLPEELKARDQLEAAGGTAAIAHVLEYPTSANVAAHARILRDKHARRATRKIATEIYQAMNDPGAELETVVNRSVDQLARALAYQRPEDADLNLRAQILSGPALIAADLPPIQPLVGAGIMVKGGFAILAGAGGSGKTFLALQLMRSVATGTPWLGYDVPRGRAGMLELEMPAASIRDRLKQGIEGPAAEAMEFLIMPEGLGKLTEPRVADQITRWCERARLDVLIMDPLFDLFEGDEKDAETMKALTRQVDRIRRRSGTALVLLQHVNKMQIDKNTGLRTAVRLAMRASGKLFDDADTVIGMLEQHGRMMLVFAKTRFCASGEAIAIRQDPTGYFELGETPEQVADHTEAKIMKCLEFVGAAGAAIDDLERLTTVKRATLYRHLKGLVDRRIVVNVARRFFAVEAAGNQDELGDF